MTEKFATVSVIIPVLDKASDLYLNKCLRSIRESFYPQDKIQIIIKEGLPAERAKGEALKEVKGEYVCFLDSDNVLLPNYLNEAIKALQENPHAFGVEAEYFPCGNDLNIFLTTVLHISDPLSELVAEKPKNYDIPIVGYNKYTCKGSYPLGANGFVYRKKDLEYICAWFEFEDTQIPLRLMKNGFLYWLRMRDTGIKHYYVDSLKQLLQKRRRQAFHFLLKREVKSVGWMDINPKMHIYVAMLYCFSFIGPLFRMFSNLKYSPLWKWYPLVCMTSALGTIWGVLSYLLGAEETSLQPRRTLCSGN